MYGRQSVISRHVGLLKTQMWRFSRSWRRKSLSPSKLDAGQMRKGCSYVKAWDNRFTKNMSGKTWIPSSTFQTDESNGFCGATNLVAAVIFSEIYQFCLLWAFAVDFSSHILSSFHQQCGFSGRRLHQSGWSHEQDRSKGVHSTGDKGCGSWDRLGRGGKIVCCWSNSRRVPDTVCSTYELVFMYWIDPWSSSVSV